MEGEEERRGLWGGGREELEKGGEGGRSDPKGADKGRGAGERGGAGGGGAKGAGRPTPSCAAAALSAPLEVSRARRPLAEQPPKPGRSTPTFQLHGPRSAREMQPARDAGKVPGAGRGERGSGGELRGARCGALGGPLSSVPLPPRRKFSRGVPCPVQVSPSVLVCRYSPPSFTRGWGFPGVRTPQGQRGRGAPARPPFAGESCGSGLASPSDLWGSILLSGPRATSGRHSRPIPEVPRKPWRKGAGWQVPGWQAPTALEGVRPQSCLLLTRSRHVSLEGSSLEQGARRLGALGPRGTSSLPAPGPPPELISEVVGNLCVFSHPRGNCFGPTGPLLHFERLRCTQLLSWQSPGDSREAWWSDRGDRGWVQSSWGSLWALGCSPHLCPSVAGAERQASERCNALYSQVGGIWVPRTYTPREQRPFLQLDRCIVSTLHVMNE